MRTLGYWLGAVVELSVWAHVRDVGVCLVAIALWWWALWVCSL